MKKRPYCAADIQEAIVCTHGRRLPLSRKQPLAFSQFTIIFVVVLGAVIGLVLMNASSLSPL